MSYIGVGKTGCCHDCHFTFEEKEVLRYLPKEAQKKLRAEHASLRRAGYPRDAVIEHARREMILFQKFCPQSLVDQVQADHESLLAC
jgi:hypothetical protein